MYRAIFYRGDILAQHPPVLRYKGVELTPYFTEHFGNRWLLYYASDTPEPTSPEWGKGQGGTVSHRRARGTTGRDYRGAAPVGSEAGKGSGVKQFVAFSGGIDSTALAILMPDATPVFTDTEWEFDELYAHLDSFETVTGREVIRVKHPKYPHGLPEYIRATKFLPNHGARFCTRLFKIEAMNLYYQSLGEAIELNIGLRADEPAEERVGNLTELDGLTIRYPLREMNYTRADCVRICLEHNLLPRYPVYMARGGCKGCFYKRASEVKAMIQLVPDVVNELRALEESVQDERGSYFHMFPNAAASIADLCRQPVLFDMSELYAEAADRSDFGQACGMFCGR